MSRNRSPEESSADWLPHEARRHVQPLPGTVNQAVFDDVDAWRQGISRAFVPLAPEPLGVGRFQGSFRQIERGSISFARIEGTPQRVRRGTREIAATRGNVAYLNIQLSGIGQIRGGGAVRATAPGSGAIVLAEQSFELEFAAPFRQLCVAMPVDWLRDRLQLPLAVVATRNLDLLDGRGRVVRAALGALIEAEDAGEAAMCGDLFAAALDHALRAGPPPVATATTLARAVARLLRQHLGDDALTPARAASMLGCSVRTLHAACQREGKSFGRMLRDARLDAAERALRSAPVSPGRVGQIAFACGFADLSHFSRAFRARFGTTPSGYRGPAA